MNIICTNWLLVIFKSCFSLTDCSGVSQVVRVVGSDHVFSVKLLDEEGPDFGSDSSTVTSTKLVPLSFSDYLIKMLLEFCLIASS